VLNLLAKHGNFVMGAGQKLNAVFGDPSITQASGKAGGLDAPSGSISIYAGGTVTIGDLAAGDTVVITGLKGIAFQGRDAISGKKSVLGSADEGVGIVAKTIALSSVPTVSSGSGLAFLNYQNGLSIGGTAYTSAQAVAQNIVQTPDSTL